MLDRTYLLRQAATLLRLASASSNPVVYGRLAIKAAEIKEELERNPSPPDADAAGASLADAPSSAADRMASGSCDMTK